MSVVGTSYGTRSHIEGEVHKLPKISKRSIYDKIIYSLDVLVPEDEDEEIFVPRDSFLQQVHHGHVHRWRVQRNTNRNLPEYLTDHLSLDEPYIVMHEKKGLLAAFDLASPFLKKWDALSFALLVFTASVTPWETAFINGPLQINVLFLINILVDLVFFTDMFVQMRTPYRDSQTGKLVRDISRISTKYLRTWFFIDLLSVIPFELLELVKDGKTDLYQLRLLRFLRLARLLKLIRVFRASRKLKQWQVQGGLRMTTVQVLTTIITTLFAMHWLACGYRICAEGSDTSVPAGWVAAYLKSINSTTANIWEIYFVSMYWAASVISLVGNNSSFLAAGSLAEWIYSTFAYIAAYWLAGYFIARTANFLSSSGSVKMNQEVLVDDYLGMLDSLKLDRRLKQKVFEHLADHFSAQTNQRQTKMLRDLPVSLHGFIALEMFLPFIESIPYLEVFIDRDPQMIQDICRLVEIRTCASNNFLFTEGYDGIYFIEHGIVAIEGQVYPSGSLFGRTVLRETIKKNECRALTDVQYFVIPRQDFIAIMDKFPKIKYYAKRWTAWQLVRDYIHTYTKLYFTAAKRGAKLSPPLLSRRPNMAEDELDDIDIAVLDHIADTGF
ncbi:hypothetical protein QVD99_002017 [Batrachochytrium dendrobatidis]|nr:hypothetical protein O5D80_000659 [Batrachochytrium dendrobatidis]KAK5672215.1 hypothetical protein QVD99_002017 [Batrachochytrium dendrobatidis]